MKSVPGLALFLALLPASALFAQTQQANNSFSQTNLVADNASFNPQIVNPDLIDAWGIALRPPGAGGHIWIANAVSGDSDEYIGDVNGIPLHQDPLTTVPLVAPKFIDHSSPFVTGLAYNSSSDLAGQAAEFPVSGPRDQREYRGFARHGQRDGKVCLRDPGRVHQCVALQHCHGHGQCSDHHRLLEDGGPIAVSDELRLHRRGHDAKRLLEARPTPTTARA